jgi:selenophosphate synthase
VASVTAEPLHAPRLTSLSPGAGCACKLPLAKLEALFAGLQGTPAMGPAAGDLLIGAAEGDDAAEVAVLLHDAQTSGGLLLAAPPQATPALLGELRAQGLPAALIGDVVAGESGHVDVYPARSA